MANPSPHTTGEQPKAKLQPKRNARLARPDRSNPYAKIIEDLRTYNAWRRGQHDRQPKPAEIGQTIDAAISALTQEGERR